MFMTSRDVSRTISYVNVTLIHYNVSSVITCKHDGISAWKMHANHFVLRRNLEKIFAASIINILCTYV